MIEEETTNILLSELLARIVRGCQDMAWFALSARLVWRAYRGVGDPDLQFSSCMGINIVMSQTTLNRFAKPQKYFCARIVLVRPIQNI
jgi:hypothetical protein